ncbi:hypothetical protein L6164_026064 [Bauhinia variegata]|uniref:Uncharacterized protein n=1 Tax=Bauhinia variegata TaxID=167791 RepID=A0ACB9M6D7_BAUVA|nr:hypothetical protein L6164_026064 [Bauhinia variegata]
MWRSWGKSSVRILHTSSSHSPYPSPNFSCSSFKDIPTLGLDEPPQPTTPSYRKPSVFHRVRLAKSLLRTWSALTPAQLEQRRKPEPESKPDVTLPDPSSRNLNLTVHPPQPPPSISIPGTDQRIVVFFTSLRVVRSTFEDCRAVRSILRGFRVLMDERDVSIDSGFMSELQEILGQNKLTLPRVFIGGRYIGGADEVRQLNETGELKKLVEGLPAADLSLCDVCGGYRFVLCNDCNGSRKLYSEKAGFKTCAACNENGLIRCPSCSFAPF